jgi:hypothetical protein
MAQFGAITLATYNFLSNFQLAVTSKPTFNLWRTPKLQSTQFTTYFFNLLSSSELTFDSQCLTFRPATFVFSTNSQLIPKFNLQHILNLKLLKTYLFLSTLRGYNLLSTFNSPSTHSEFEFLTDPLIVYLIMNNDVFIEP